MVTDKRGAALVVIIVFTIVSVIASYALYSSVYNLFRIHGIKEVKLAKDHYLASAGIAYASMLLQDPIAYAKFTTDPPPDNQMRQKIITSVDAMGINLGLTGPAKITVDMTYHVEPNKYSVTSTYSD